MMFNDNQDSNDINGTVAGVPRPAGEEYNVRLLRSLIGEILITTKTKNILNSNLEHKEYERNRKTTTSL